MESSPKTPLVISALLDIPIGALALNVGFAAAAFSDPEPVGIIVIIILFGIVAGCLRGGSGADNPWIKGLIIGGYALVAFVFFAVWAALGWHYRHQSTMPMPEYQTYDAYLHHELRNKLAVIVLPLLFVPSAILGAGLCYLQNPLISKIVNALLDILTGAVFLLGFAVLLGFIVESHRTDDSWVYIVFLGFMVASFAAGFWRSRSGFANPWGKGLLVGGVDLLLFVVAWGAVQNGSGEYLPVLLLLLGFVLCNIAGAWLRHRKKPSNSKMVSA